MRKIRVILLALFISTLSVFPTTVKADREVYSTVQVRGSLSSDESEESERVEEDHLEKKTTVIKQAKLPATGSNGEEVVFFMGLLFILLALLVKIQKKALN